MISKVSVSYTHLVRIALQTVDGRAGQAAQRWHGRGNADAQERKNALGKAGRRDLQCGGDDERADAVRQNVLFDAADRAGAKSAGGGDVLEMCIRDRPTIMICIFPSLFPPAAQINAVLKFFQRY